MDEDKATLRYSHKAKTVEAPTTSPLMRALLGISLAVQLVGGLGLFFMGIYAFTLCSPTTDKDFAGITPITSSIYCLLIVTISIFVCKQMRMFGMAFGVINFVVAAAIVIYESAAYRCKIKDSDSQSQKPTSMCEGLQNSLNGCRWLDTTTGGEPEGEQWGGRLVMTIFAGLCLLSSITTLIFMFLAIKLGKPVYLALKRHKCSIVVGQAKNAEAALENRIKNLDLTTARAIEEDGYDKKRKDRLKEYFSSRKTNASGRRSRMSNTNEGDSVDQSREANDNDVQQSRNASEEIVQSRKSSKKSSKKSRRPSTSSTQQQSGSRK